MNKEISLLKKVTEHKEALAEIETFTSLNNKIKTSNFSGSKKNFRKWTYELIKEAKALSNNIEQQYGVPSEASLLFLSLDKVMYSKFTSVQRLKLYPGLSFPKNYFAEDPHLCPTVNGADFQYHYSRGAYDLCILNWFETRINLLPSSTQKYLKSKIRERNNKASLQPILNSFQERILILSLPEKFSTSKINTLIKYFKNLNDIDSSISTFHLYSAITTKYNTELHNSNVHSSIIATVKLFMLNLNKIFLFYTDNKTEIDKVKKILNDNEEFRNLITKMSGTYYLNKQSHEVLGHI